MASGLMNNGNNVLQQPWVAPPSTLTTSDPIWPPVHELWPPTWTL